MLLLFFCCAAIPSGRRRENSRWRPGLWLVKTHVLIPYTATDGALLERTNTPQDAV